MNRRFMMRSASRAMLIIAVSILCAGCLGRSPAVRHFMLGVSESASTVDRLPDIAILVGPVRLPAYLDRSQIATFEGNGEIFLNEFDRWLGGFKGNFLRALSLGLARELGSTRIVVDPSKAPFAIDYQIRLHVDDLILEIGEGFRIRVRWALIPIREGASQEFFVMDELIAVDGDSIEDVVRAHEAALSELARRVADELVARGSES